MVNQKKGKKLINLWVDESEVETLRSNLARMVQPIGHQSLEEFTSREVKVNEIIYKAYKSGLIDFN